MKASRLTFRFAAAGALLAVIAFGGWVQLNIGGTATTTAVDDVGEAVAAAIAALACWWAAGRTHGRQRMSWLLIGAFGFAWCLGELVWTYYEVGRGISVPFPSLADVGFLGAIPFGVAGLVALPAAARSRVMRARTVFDFATVSLSLFFVSWAAVLVPVATHSSTDLFSVVVSLAYPAGDLLMASIVVVAASRARGTERVPLLLLLAGVLAIAFSDSAFSYLTAAANYTGNVLDTGWVAGFLLIALAPLAPSAPPAERPDELATPVWQLGIPWATIVLFAATAIVLAVRQGGLDPVETEVAAGLGLLLVVSRALSYYDSRRFIAQLVDVADRLRASESRFRAIYDGAPVAIVRITPDLTVAESNPGLTRILGYRADQLAGMALARFTAQDDREVFGTAWAELAAGDPSVEFETDAARADGSAVRLRWTATALHDERGMYLLAVVEDVTAERAAEAAERAARRELERVNQLKTDFISIVSHEFRTALTGVQGFSEVLRDQLLDPEEVREYAGDINADAKRLNRMITEMLDLDRLESGRVTVNPEPTDVAALLADAVSRAEAIGPEHRFEYRVDEQLPEVLADHDKITQVATNLLSNAVKYSPAGSLVEVGARASGDEVEISVRDHGPGIPAESRQAVFERFTRLETSGSRVSGTGLGLAIARQIVELHGGRIWVDNPDGGGACFHFTLKAVAGPRRRRKAAAQRAT